jgi:hypothetical protein
MLRPMPIDPMPPEMACVARAAFPKGTRYLRLADELDTLFTDETFGALFPPHGQPHAPHGGSRWSPSSHARRDSLAAKRRMPCGVASIGNTSCAWSSRIPGSMRRSSANFAAACWPGRRRLCCLIPCSRGAATASYQSQGSPTHGVDPYPGGDTGPQPD